MKRLICLLLALAVLLPAAAMAEEEGWKTQTNGGYTIRLPAYMQVYSVIDDEIGWDLDVLEDPAGTDAAGSTVSILICFAGADDWMYWRDEGIILDERGRLEEMERLEVDEPPADIDAGMETSYAAYLSGDGTRVAELYVFDPEEGDTDYVVICRYPARDGGKYSDPLHEMLETLSFAESLPSWGEDEPSGARGAFFLTGRWEYDGWHEVIKDVVVDKKVSDMYWIYVSEDVTRVKVEKLTWNTRTLKVKSAKSLYTVKKLTPKQVLAIHGRLPDGLPTVRIRCVNAQGLEEVWYVGRDADNGSPLLLSEEEVGQ